MSASVFESNDDCKIECLGNIKMASVSAQEILYHQSKMPKSTVKNSTKIPSLNVAMAMRKASKIYRFDKISKILDDYIINCINNETVFKIFEEALNNSYTNISNYCKHFIQNNANYLLQASHFQYLTFEMVETISQLKLKLYSEVTLFEALFEWAKDECRRSNVETNVKNIRHIINPLLPHVKFLSMSEKEFREGPAQSAVFTKEEIFQILQKIKNPESSSDLPSWCSEKNKLYLPYYVCIIDCNRKKYETKQTAYLGFCFTLQKKDIWFCGMELCLRNSYHLLKHNQFFSIWIIVESIKEVILAYGEVVTYRDDGNCRIMLTVPKFLAAEDSYVVTMHAHEPLNTTPFVTCLVDNKEYNQSSNGAKFIFHQIPPYYGKDIQNIHVHEILFKFQIM
ncbi:BTB/POZ domain-containing protein 6-like isoform X2 [Centruroides sculpturatus]|uniref:BTB/POZ domain-containing protein 6-like isoform X2 n=1 Tax=Centruroides sculpturatus TaxID=218467 RepID=UPI000C6CD5D4|nr:BTB/POZ domain-containing protein 6-like isoform X2 [Centruroides sculpturatus]